MQPIDSGGSKRDCLIFYWFLLTDNNYCYVFESRRRRRPFKLTFVTFISRLNMVVRVNVLTATDVSTTCAVVILRVKVSYITSVDGIKLWLLT